MLKRLKKNVFVFFLAVLVFDVLFDPANKMFHAKTGLFLLVVFIGMLLYLRKVVNIKIIIYIVVFLLISICGLYAGLCVGNSSAYDFDAAVSLSSSFMFFLLIFVVYEKQNEFNHVLIFMLALLSVFIIYLMYSLMATENAGVNALIIYLNYTVESAKITYRQFGSIELPMIYYKTSPLILVGVAALYYATCSPRVKYCIYPVYFIALALSGTRANIIISVLVLFVLIYLKSGAFSRALLLSCCCVILFFIAPLLIDSFFSATEVSNEVKLGHVTSYLQLFGNARYILMGDGFGGMFYTVGNNELAVNTELVYFDIVRWFGFIPAMFVFVFLIYPSIVFWQKKQVMLFVCYVGYMAISASNPLFMSSTGMLAMVYFFLSAANGKKLIEVNSHRNSVD